jgi:hypothetical protein
MYFSSLEQKRRHKANEALKEQELFYKRQGQRMAELARNDKAEEERLRRSKLRMQYEMLEEQRRTDSRIQRAYL